MLSRYTIYRGKRPPNSPLPKGVRQDTRKHTGHCLRPTRQIVEAYLANPSESAWRKFEDEYLAVLAERFKKDRAPFDELAELAENDDVYIGCSCPSRTNPDVMHCHTVAALRFIKQKYPRLRIVMPEGGSRRL